MRLFRFRLERVLNYRRLREEKLRNQLASVDDAIRSRRERLGVCREMTNTRHRQLRGRQTRGIKGWETHLYSLFIRRMEGEISKQQKSIEEFRALRSERQKELQLASCNRKAPEKLKARAWEKFKSGLLHEEQKHIDEVAARSFRHPGRL